MTDNEETPETGLAEVSPETVAELPLPQSVDDMLNYIMEHLGSGADPEREARQAAHEKRTEVVSRKLAQSLGEADETVPEEFASEKLSWGLWRSGCGCLHFAIPDGSGGWLWGNSDGLDQALTSKLVEQVAQDLASAQELMQSLLRELGYQGR